MGWFNALMNEFIAACVAGYYFSDLDKKKKLFCIKIRFNRVT